MAGAHTQSWQLILADLALILFLVTLVALGAKAAREGSASREVSMPQIDQSQALFRPSALGPSLAEWLARQSPDARATLTIFARHSGGDEAAMWERAQALAASARAQGFGVRVMIDEGETSDLYASLAYDAPFATDRTD